MRIRKLLPEFLKKTIRFIYYNKERNKVFREIKIRRQQNKQIKQSFKPETENLIVFIVDGASWFTGKDTISGGVLSIASIYEETEKLKKIHNSEVIMITHKKAHLLLKHTQFPNKIDIYRFEILFKYFRKLRKVIFHFPEYLTNNLYKQFLTEQIFLSEIPDIQINILNQNILLMPTKEEIHNLFKFSDKITQTTAHDKYSTIKYRQKYEIPLHKLSAYASPERYSISEYKDKDNLIIISPDKNKYKEIIISKIKQELPNYKIVIINNLLYLDYLKLVQKAKFSITFGEGLDFYLSETIFSGGISFSVFNKNFYTSDYMDFPVIYFSFQEMAEKIVRDIKYYDNNEWFKFYNKKQFTFLSKFYKFDEYLENIRLFYNQNYTFK